MTLAGVWLLALGTPEPTYPQAALPPLTFTDTIELPGTTETREKGRLSSAAPDSMLTRIRKFDGAAWYARDVDVPASWAGRELELFLERTKYVQVWWDDQPVGEQGWYLTPSVLRIPGAATPGRHRLTVMIDNRPERRPAFSDAHQFSDNTQTNWNGIIGRMELRARGDVVIERVRLDGRVPQRSFEASVLITNRTGRVLDARVTAEASSFNHPGPSQTPEPVRTSVRLQPGTHPARFQIPLGQTARTWDEFDPSLYRVTISVETDSAKDRAVVETGLRDLGRNGTQFTMNGRTVFFRGKHDACVFPLTGHPPMDVDGWLSYLRVCREYGINMVRCHTWTPPEAAFAAADRLGIYLEPELPFWGDFDEKVRAWLEPEAERVLEAYGNHPCFILMTLGNELGGDLPVLASVLERLRSMDDRHLYAEAANATLWDPQVRTANDFIISAKVVAPETKKTGAIRGSYTFSDDRQGEFGLVQSGSGATDWDFREALRGVPFPVIGHETGQYTMYPDYHEISDYTGVTRARNLEQFRESLARRGMLDQAEAFSAASGALAAELYREDIEASLRTPGFGGYQLLDLQDFPGQGTALVGILDAFMRSKGAITADAWRTFVAPIVPLARLPARTWTGGTEVNVPLEVAHYGPDDLRDAKVSWALSDEEGREVASGGRAVSQIQAGGLRPLGTARVALPSVQRAARLEFVVRVEGANTALRQSWPVWVFPKDPSIEPPRNVRLATQLDQQTVEALEAGARVFLMPGEQPWNASIEGGYATDFWNWPMFNNAPGTLGLLIQNKHPALEAFPTGTHSERQWTRIAQASRPVLLTDLGTPVRPIVQVIDNYARNERLGLVFEVSVGKGRLLVCAANLRAHTSDPAARQLLSSLLAYAASERFAPPQTADVERLTQVLQPSLSTGAPVTVSSSSEVVWQPLIKRTSITDGSPSSRWMAEASDAAPEVVIDLKQPRRGRTLMLQWEHDRTGYRYTVEGLSETGWSKVVDASASPAGGRHWHSLPDTAIRQLRIRVLGTPDGKPVGLREVAVLGDRAP